MKPVADASKYLNFNSNVAYQWRAISHRIFTFFLVSQHWDNKEKAIGGKRKNNSKTASRFETQADSRFETKELGSCLTEILAYAGASRLLFYFTFFFCYIATMWFLFSDASQWDGLSNVSSYFCNNYIPSCIGKWSLKEIWEKPFSSYRTIMICSDQYNNVSFHTALIIHAFA